MFALTPIALLILAIAGGGITKAAEHHAEKKAAIETGQTEAVEVREETQPFKCELDTPEADCQPVARDGETFAQKN